MPVIYIDVLMALNLFIDFLLLTVTVRSLLTALGGGMVGAMAGALAAMLLR